MHWFKSSRLDGLLLPVLWALLGWLSLSSAHAELGGVQLRDFALTNTAEGVHLSAQVDIALSPAMSDALQKGVPLYFVAQARVIRSRWYWRDEVVGLTRRYMRLAYQPLTRRWRLNASASPLVASGLGVSLSQNFEELDAALHAMGRFAQWQVAPTGYRSVADHRVAFEFGIDVQQLPRPFVIGQSGGPDWSLHLSHEAAMPAPPQ